jgi:hypothetical protein
MYSTRRSASHSGGQTLLLGGDRDRCEPLAVEQLAVVRQDHAKIDRVHTRTLPRKEKDEP